MVPALSRASLLSVRHPASAPVAASRSQRRRAADSSIEEDMVHSRASPAARRDACSTARLAESTKNKRDYSAMHSSKQTQSGPPHVNRPCEAALEYSSMLAQPLGRAADSSQITALGTAEVQQQHKDQELHRGAGQGRQHIEGAGQVELWSGPATLEMEKQTVEQLFHTWNSSRLAIFAHNSIPVICEQPTKVYSV